MTYSFKGSSGNLKKHAVGHAKEGGDDDSKQLRADIRQYCEQAPQVEKMIVRWLILTFQPVSVVEHQAFKDMLHSINPRIRVPSRRDVTRDILALEGIAREGVIAELEGQMVALTSDAWTSAAVEAFLSLTVHYLTSDFVPVSLPVECSPFPGSHTAERIFEKTEQLLQHNGIKIEFVSAMVADNAASQAKAGSMAAFDSCACAAHTLQLTAKKLLDVPEVAATLKISRKIVGSVKHSCLKGEELRREQEQTSSRIMRLLQDVKTRWSSTYRHLSVMLQNKGPVSILCMRHAEPAAQQRAKKTRVAPAAATASAAGPVALTLTFKTNAATRSQTNAVPALPVGHLADEASESDSDLGYSSSDDGSVDLDLPDQRIGTPLPDQSPDTVDISSESSNASSDEAAAPRSSRGGGRGGRGGGGKRGRDRGRGRSRGRGGSAAPAVAALKRRAPSEKKKSKYMMQLSEMQWQLIALLVELLQPIADAQTALEGEKYITLSGVPFQIRLIRERLEHFSAVDDSVMVMAAQHLLEDFNTRWTEWPRATKLAVVLDPRVKKMKCFERELRVEIWDELRREMKDVYMLMFKRTTAPLTADTTEEAASSSSTAAGRAAVHLFPGRDAESDSDLEDVVSSDQVTFDDAQDYRLRHLDRDIADELALYKKELQIDTDADPFAWWRARAAQYPKLSLVARKWLAVPASSAASERLFSSAGLTVTDKRTSLGSELVSSLVFLKSAWPVLEAKGILYGPNARKSPEGTAK